MNITFEDSPFGFVVLQNQEDIGLIFLLDSIYVFEPVLDSKAIYTLDLIECIGNKLRELNKPLRKHNE